MAEVISFPVEEKPMTFPIGCLPAVMQKFCEEAAEVNQVPLEFLAIPALAAAGVAIGTSRMLEVKPAWVFRPNLFAAIVAPPGGGKTPAQDAALVPLEKMQAEAARLYEQEKEDYERELESWLETPRGERGPRPKPPRMKEVIVKDTTVEALGETLSFNPRGLLVVQDELTAWVLSMNQYRQGRGADRQHYLSLWSGTMLKVNRKSRDPLVIERPLVSVVGCIPPTVLGQLTDERSEGEDGFLHRILFAYPELGESFWSDNEISRSTWRDYFDLFEALFALSPNLDGSPEVVRLSAGAKRVWVHRYDRNAGALRHFEASFSPLRGVWAKAPSQAARLALILHCCKHVAGEAEALVLSEETMKEAWQLVEYFKSHAKRVYRELTKSPLDRKAEALLAWVKKKGGEVAVRDIVTNNVAGCESKADVMRLVERLIANRMAEIVKRKTGGKGRPQELLTVRADEE